MELKIWLQSERGRLAKLSTEIGIKPPVISAWISGRRPIPVARAAQIEKATNGEVTRMDMFPDEYLRIWPELYRPDEKSELTGRQAA